MSNWIVVGSPENFEIARARGFDMIGFKDKRKRESASMEPGDQLIFYLIGIMKFGGIAEVTGSAYVDESPVFKTEKKPGEKYSNRIPTKPVRILDEDQYLDVKEYADQLEMTRSRGEYWRLAFQGNLHKLTSADYELLKKDIDAAAKAPAR
jgi:hypothetical protein